MCHENTNSIEFINDSFPVHNSNCVHEIYFILLFLCSASDFKISTTACVAV